MVSHWDELRVREVAAGEVRGRWRRLGSARAGLRRIEVAPGARSMPVHVHAETDEVFYVLGGSGRCWQDGRTCAIGAGDCVVHRAKREAHTLLAGPDGLDVLAFGRETGADLTWLPRAQVFWAGARWIPGDAAHPFEAEAAAGPLEAAEADAERPPNVVALDAVDPLEWGEGDVRAVVRDLGEAAGTRDAGLQHLAVAPEMLSGPPHCHSTEEEIFVVLGGAGVALLGDEEHPVRAGHLVHRPPGTGVAHAFRAGAQGLSLLAFGTREPDDICFYPRSQKVSLRGVRAIFRVQRVDYWDGEA
ncbi:MAG TPA: cupin domain-containing protein [Solirubrobacteraceae bacterium]|nr:cupin domain-containing protein [Solirubrobacteraceae bacterium]